MWPSPYISPLHQNWGIFQGVACKVTIFGYSFFRCQSLISEWKPFICVWSTLSVSTTYFLAFFAFDHLDYIRCLSESAGSNFFERVWSKANSENFSGLRSNLWNTTLWQLNWWSTLQRYFGISAFVNFYSFNLELWSFECVGFINSYTSQNYSFRWFHDYIKNGLCNSWANLIIWVNFFYQLSSYL